MSIKERRVARDEIGAATVSTVKLIVPIDGEYWETIVFGGEHNRLQQRYKTLEAALEGHRGIVGIVRGGE